MNTLSAPRSTVHISSPPATGARRRPSLVDRLAMHVGLRLLLWGRHRARLRSLRDAASRRLLAEQVRQDYDRTHAHSAGTLTIR
ncbi:hypothetical protein AB0N73_01190 [Microbacterium sp. NPDC089189]|uniref:hypothetical protein n=1 Tax=Microbacterium sp. NPDC089189 TaxID=3154972 RepID=UPI003420C16C